MRAYRARNKETLLAKRREYAARVGLKDKDAARYVVFRDRIAAVKLESGCVDCGYRLHVAALDFDHLPGTDKKFCVGQGMGYRWESVLEEIAKCEVVCANCHRVRTANRRLEVA